MKAIIIAGVSLFAAATIYGVTDFAADKKSGAIDKLYKEEPAPAPEEKEISATPVALKEAAKAAIKSETVTKKSTAKRKQKKNKSVFIKTIKFSDFSRGRIERKVIKEEAAKQ